MIRGNDHVTEDEILQLSNVTDQDNLLSLDLKSIAKSIEAHPCRAGATDGCHRASVSSCEAERRNLCRREPAGCQFPPPQPAVALRNLEGG
ncbi:MAG: FtsQ-type POTRA domain-containing protein, partial [Dissulfuribacterales bacterium]